MSNNTLLQQENSLVHKEILVANKSYVKDFGVKGELPLPPGRKFAILTCMDARLDPAKYAGLSEGDAHVIRNAGGRASDDAIRSLVISHKLLGTAEWFVIHHTDCGMEYFTDDIIRNLLSKSLATATVDENGWRNLTEEGGSVEAQHISFLTISNQAQSILEDIKRIKNHPLVPSYIPIYGYIYDVKTGELIEVTETTSYGRAS
jgi:carbonic anhydrase